MKKIDLGNRIHEAMKIWNEGLIMSKNGYLYMGKALYMMKKDRLYMSLGNHVISWKYWVENELHLSKAQADRLIQIYRDLGHILEKDGMAIDIGKVTLLLPLLNGRTDEEKESLINMAKDCRIEDVKNNIATKRLQAMAFDVCEHHNTELASRCRDCGKWLK